MTRVRLLARAEGQSSGEVGANPGSSGSFQIPVSVGIVGYLKYFAAVGPAGVTEEPPKTNEGKGTKGRRGGKGKTGRSDQPYI